MGDMTPEQIEKSRAAEAFMREHVREGDVLLHVVCMGRAQEHIFTGWDGRWLCGKPTRETMRHEKLEGRPERHAVNDIAPVNVTHINRDAVGAIPTLIEMGAWRKEGR